jgi:hypothetical protein
MKNLFFFMVLAAAGFFLYMVFALEGPGRNPLQLRPKEAVATRSEGAVSRAEDTIDRVLETGKSVGENTGKAIKAVDLGGK